MSDPRLFNKVDTIIKVLGLPRTGTNYVERMVRVNFEVAVLGSQVLGWKHGEPTDVLDWKGRNWARPYGMERLKEVEPWLVVKDRIENIYNSGRFFYIICVKNPYAWYNSIQNIHGQRLKPLKTVNFTWWNERNGQYKNFIPEVNDRYYICRFEDFYENNISDGYKVFLENICNRFNLISKNNSYVNFNNVTGPQSIWGRRDAQSGNIFRLQRYRDKFYLSNLSKDDLDVMNKNIDWSLMDFFNYKKEEKNA